MKKAMVTLVLFALVLSTLCMAVTAHAQKVTKGAVQKVAEIPGMGMIDGPAYVPDDGMLYFVEMEAGWVSKIGIDGRNYEKVFNLGKLGGKVGAKSMRWDRIGKRLLICHRTYGILSLDPKTKECVTLIDTYQEERFNGPDDVTMDAEGNIYFSDPWGTGITNPTGGVYRRVGGDGLGQKIIKIMDNMQFPDGILISPDESWIYIGELSTNRIVRAFLIDGGRDTLFPHVFASFNTAGGPDGMVMDNAGNLYVAHWGGGVVYVLEPKKGQVIEEITIPDPDGTNVTNVGFGGPNNSTLFITESVKRTIWKIEIQNKGRTMPPEE
ncbi:SMP-30/gluconolactonase/LRE family protein [Candidatus Latescibacterota bacterium]